MTSTQISSQATIGSATIRPIRNAIMQARKTNNVEPVPRTTMGSIIRRTTSNTTRM